MKGSYNLHRANGEKLFSRVRIHPCLYVTPGGEVGGRAAALSFRPYIYLKVNLKRQISLGAAERSSSGPRNAPPLRAGLRCARCIPTSATTESEIAKTPLTSSDVPHRQRFVQQQPPERGPYTVLLWCLAAQVRPAHLHATSKTVRLPVDCQVPGHPLHAPAKLRLPLRSHKTSKIPAAKPSALFSVAPSGSGLG